MDSQDIILKQLVIKKRKLLAKLLNLSQRDAINANESILDHILKQRIQFLNKLKENDNFIQLREIEIGVQAKNQERNLFAEIGSLIRIIHENNDHTLQELDKNKKSIGKDKINLRQETKISGYLRQMNSKGFLNPNKSQGKKSHLSDKQTIKAKYNSI